MRIKSYLSSLEWAFIPESSLSRNGYKTKKIIKALAKRADTLTGDDLKQAAIKILLLNLKETNTSPSERSDPNSLVRTVRPPVGGINRLPGRPENAKSNPVDALYARHAALDVLGKNQVGWDYQRVKSILEEVSRITYVAAPPVGVRREVEWVLPTWDSCPPFAPIDLGQSLTDIALQIYKQDNKTLTAWSYSGMAPGQLLILASSLYLSSMWLVNQSEEKAAQTLVAAACLVPSSFGITDVDLKASVNLKAPVGLKRFRELGESLKHVFEMYLPVGNASMETPRLEIADFGGPA